jgi:hypothetical protein
MVACALAVVPALARQDNRIDTLSPLAPELASFGAHTVGVRTLQVVDHGRPDILNTKEGEATVRYNRALSLEVWYPAPAAGAATPSGEYRTVLRDGVTSTTLRGRAMRDAAPWPWHASAWVWSNLRCGRGQSACARGCARLGGTRVALGGGVGVR